MHRRGAILRARKGERAENKAERYGVRARVALLAERIPCQPVAEAVHQVACHCPGMPCTKTAWMSPGRRLGCVRELLLGATKIVDIIGSAVKLMFFSEIVINSRNVRVQVIRGQGIKSETGSIQQSSGRTVTCVEVVGRITRSRGRKCRNRRRVSSGVRENSGDLRR